ncbi:GNAT family N-acetyltransferase [Gemmatimonadota bacterium]
MALLRSGTSRRNAETVIRTVRPSDAEAVRRVLQVAFADENRRMGLKDTRLPTIRDELLAFYLDRSPEASFVAEGRGGLFGFCLACRWGRVGWMGPIAVLPPAQGEGMGQRLIYASTTALREAGVRTLGVETMPRSYRNLQLYTRLGMRFGPMTFDLSRVWKGEEAPLMDSEEAGGRGIVVQAVGPDGDAGERERAMGIVARLSSEVAEGLDYRLEASTTLDHRFGMILLAGDGSGGDIGFAVVHTEPYAREEASGTARINTLVMAPGPALDARAGFREFTKAILARLSEAGLDAAIFRVTADQPIALETLQEMGFRITHSDVRLTYRDLPVRDRPGTVHLSKWE